MASLSLNLALQMSRRLKKRFRLIINYFLSMKLLYTISILIVMLQACAVTNETVKEIQENKAFESFEQLPLEQKTVTPFLPKELSEKLILGSWAKLITYDSTIVILSNKFDSFISLIDLKKGNIIDTGMEGRGPGELATPMSVIKSPVDGYFDVFDTNLKAIFRYNLDSSLHYTSTYLPQKINLVRPDEKFFDYFGLEYGFLGENKIVGYGNFYNQNRWSIYNTDNKTFKYTHEYTFDPEDKAETMFKTLAYQGSMVTQNNKLVWMCSYSPIIEFYEFSSDSLRLKNRVQKGTVKYIADNSGGGIGSALKPENQMGFITLDVDNKHIYTLYSGELIKNTKGDGKGDKIYVFDWEGNFIKGYKTDQELIGLTKVPEQDLLYVVSASTGELLKMEL